MLADTAMEFMTHYRVLAVQMRLKSARIHPQVFLSFVDLVIDHLASGAGPGCCAHAAFKAMPPEEQEQHPEMIFTLTQLENPAFRRSEIYYTVDTRLESLQSLRSIIERIVNAAA